MLTNQLIYLTDWKETINNFSSCCISTTEADKGRRWHACFHVRREVQLCFRHLTERSALTSHSRLSFLKNSSFSNLLLWSGTTRGILNAMWSILLFHWRELAKREASPRNSPVPHLFPSVFFPSYDEVCCNELVLNVRSCKSEMPPVGSPSAAAINLALIRCWAVVPHSRACDLRLLTTDACSLYFIRRMSCMAHSYFLAPRSPTYDCTPKILPPFTILSTIDGVCAGVKYTATSGGSVSFCEDLKRDARSKLPVCSYSHVTVELHRYKDAYNVLFC